MQSSKNISILNKGGEYNKFFDGLKSAISQLEQELESESESEPKKAPLSRDILEEELFGKIKEAEFKEILNSYEQQYNNRESPENDNERTIKCDSDTYRNFAQLLHSKPAFHNRYSTDHLIHDLQIENNQRLSLLGHAYGVSNFRVDEAESLEELLRKRRNEFLKTNLAAASEYLERKLYAEAEREIDTALKMDPKNGSALATRGKLLHKIHRYQEAVENFKNALNCRPDDRRQVERELSQVLEKLGENYYHRNEFRLARDKFEEALRLGTENEDLTRLHLNICTEKIGNIMKQPFGPKHELYRK